MGHQLSQYLEFVRFCGINPSQHFLTRASNKQNYYTRMLYLCAMYACIKREISSGLIKMLLARHLACQPFDVIARQGGSLAIYAYPWIFQLSPQCSTILMICKLRGKMRNCSELFEFRKTENGFCCTFNYMRESDDIPVWVSSRIFDACLTASSLRHKSCGAFHRKQTSRIPYGYYRADASYFSSQQISIFQHERNVFPEETVTYDYTRDVPLLVCIVICACYYVRAWFDAGLSIVAVALCIN